MEGFEKLEYTDLSANAQAALPANASIAAKMVAARAILPLMSGDLTLLLYHLCFDENAQVAQTARENLDELPDNIIVPVLSYAKTNRKLLTYFGLTMPNRESVAEAVALNSITPDSTFALMMQKCNNGRVMDILSANQQRLIRYPDIIHYLVHNPISPKSTIERVVKFFRTQKGHDYTEDISEELREVKQATHLPSSEYPDEVLDGDTLTEQTPEDLLDDFGEIIDEEMPPDISIQDILKEDFDVDALFAKEFLVDPEDELSNKKRQSLENRIRKMDVVSKMRLAMKGNVEVRNIMIKNSNKMIQECVIRNPQISLDEVVKIARNKSMREELIRLITMNKDWVRNYQIRISLVWNPKTPLTQAMKWLSTLNIKDLEKLSKSKQIPGMLAVTARKSLEQKMRFH